MRNTKILFSLFIIIVTLVSQKVYSQSISWQQTNGPFGGQVLELCSGPNNMIIAVAGNSLFKTNNNGNSWTKLNYDWFSTPRVAVDAGGNILLCEDGNFYKSTDGGNTWSGRVIISGQPVTNLKLNAEGHIYATIQNKIHYSTDNGNTWNVNNGNILANQIHGLSVSSDSNYFIATDNGVYRSTDQGQNWEEM